MRALLLLLCACGPAHDQIDGNRPIRLVVQPRTLQVLPDRAQVLVAQAARVVWNPRAQGEPQNVYIEMDDSGTWNCAQMPLAAWTPRPPGNVLFLCPTFSYGKPGAVGLAGERGVWFVLSHELGHILGGGHVPQNGRQRGPIMCGWGPCLADDVFDYTGEDVAEICKGGRGGSRCSTNN